MLTQNIFKNHINLIILKLNISKLSNIEKKKFNYEFSFFFHLFLKIVGGI